MTPGRSGFAGRALRRKAWSRCLFNPRRQSGGRPTPRPAGPPDWGGKEWEGRGAGAIRAALEEGSSVSRLSSRSPERAGSWGRAREPQRSLGVGRPWQRSRNQEVSGKNGEPRGQGGRSGGSSPGPEWPGQGRRGLRGREGCWEKVAGAVRALYFVSKPRSVTLWPGQPKGLGSASAQACRPFPWPPSPRRPRG